MIKKILPLGCVALLLSLLALLSIPGRASSPAQTPVTAASIASIIDQYRQQIPTRMQQENVSGLAIVVVDDQNVLWAEGFGYTDWDRRTPVTPDTLFSIQSMSKSFTATAVMFAAQDGLVDLNAPITTYLPDFHIHSIFEEHPEQKITLRLLLSHTAGLVHEAPIGGNNDLPGHTFEEHIASISNTWLKFPVGTRYSYSNLGVDLAGYILQVRSGMPFTQYVKEKVFAPLGMNASTLDINQVRAAPDRAFGHMDAPFPPPAEMLIIPSGGVWTTANDIANYLRFHINEGALDGTRLLRQDLAETMYTPPNMAALKAGYALGIARDESQNTRHFQHGGGGFGFNSNMEWYPELKLGAVVLTNSGNTQTLWQLTSEVLNSIISTNIPLYHARASDRPAVNAAYGLDLNGPNPLTDGALSNLIASKAPPLDDAARQHRQSLAGDYLTTQYGFPAITAQIQDDNGVLTGTAMGQTFPLTEVQPGLVFDSQGMSYDLYQSPAAAPNTVFFKIDLRLLPFLLGLYGLCGLFFLSALFWWPVRAMVRRIRRPKAPPEVVPGESSAGKRRWPSWNAAMAILAGLASLFSLLCLGVVALMPNLVYLPWPRPWVDLRWWQYALFLLPFASLALGAVVALAQVASLRLTGSRAWGRPLRIYYALVALALVGFNLLLIF
jgi:CubicO group peptidase (beta-lactamase class C family)